MTKSASWLAISSALLLGLTAAPALAQSQPSAPAPSLSGEWKVSLHGQHVIPVGMELAQDGDRVTGTLLMWNGEIELEGSMHDGTLTASGMHNPTDTMPAGNRTVTVTIQPDGTLAGTFAFNEKSSIKLTAERFNARAARPKPAPAAMAHTAAAASLSAFAGKWQLSLTSDPARTFDLDAKVTGDELTGTLFIDHAGLLEIKNARLEHGTLLFDISVGDGPASAISIKLADDGSLTGTVKGPMGEMPFVGKKK